MGTGSPAALLIVRAVREPDAPDGRLVAVVRSTHDVDTGFQHERAASSVDDVCEIVRRWLVEFLGADGE